MATRKKATRKKTAAKVKRTDNAKPAATKTAADKTKEKPSMSDQLCEARKRYTASKSANGTTSAHNGDDVATLLAGNTPEAVCAVAEQLAGMETGELATKYGHLNPGQMRMNSGNRIRAMVKKGTVSVDDVAKALAAL